MGCRPSKGTGGSEATDDAHASNKDGEGVSPKDVAIGTAHIAADSLFALGGAVPVVGDFFDLIANFKEQCVALLGRVDEANEVETWAQDQVNLLKEIEKKLNRRADAGSNEPADKALRQAGIKLQGCIEELKTEAKHISAGGAKARQLFRGTIHKKSFESAKEAVAEAKKGFNLALAFNTNDMVRAMLERFDALDAKIDKIANPDQKREQRTLVERIRNEPARSQEALVPVAENIVDGESEAAATALAAIPEDVRASETGKYAESLVFERALGLACRAGNVDVVQVFLDCGADVNLSDKESGRTMLCIACAEGHVHVARLLLKKGAKVNQAAKDGGTPLWTACCWGHVDAVRLLLEKGAEVDQAMPGGFTPLLVACHQGHVDVARLLLDKSAEVDRATEDGSIPLSIAKSQGHSPIVALLEEHKSSKSRDAAES